VCWRKVVSGVHRHSAAKLQAASKESTMARVLVVDDEEIIRFTLRQILEKAGHEVFEAVNGQDALNSFEEYRVDLVITDIIMPEKEGIETIVELRRRQPDLKIIAVSGGGRTRTLDYLEIAERLGASGALAKPLNRQAIMDAVSKALRSAG
jgi:YesN/AraC family two-component response regulator